LKAHVSLASWSTTPSNGLRNTKSLDVTSLPLEPLSRHAPIQSLLRSVGILITSTFADRSLGQDAVLDDHGLMRSSKGPLSKTSRTFSVHNDYGAIHFGVSAAINGAYKTIYVTEKPAVTGMVTFSPVEKVLIGFTSNMSTACMFVKADSNTIEVIYPMFR
jgi:hypothetical protein